MTSSQELLQRIAALRGRLDRLQAIAPTDAKTKPSVPSVPVVNYQAPETSLQAEATPPQNVRLTARAARLLQDARAILSELKSLADDPLLADEQTVLSQLQRESANMLDVVVRNLLTMPASSSSQLRYCEGLQGCLLAAQDKTLTLKTALANRTREQDRVATLADLLRGLVEGRPADMAPFLTLARAVVDDAAQGLPIRFLMSLQKDPAHFAACQGLAVAQVQAWILRSEIPQPQRRAEMLVPALIHDVGLVSQPADLLFKPGPLDDAEQRTLRQHAALGETIARRLWPGGGWGVDAVADHHERLDGSGYPAGKSVYALSDPARLLAVCDVYAALASPRPYRPAADPRAALADTLLLADQGRLDRAQAEKLLRLTFYPAGSVVQLSDGSVALVVGTPKALVNPAKATVILLRGPHGDAPPYPWPLDLAESNTLDILRALTAGERGQTLGRSHPALV